MEIEPIDVCRIDRYLDYRHAEGTCCYPLYARVKKEIIAKHKTQEFWVREPT